MDVSKHVFLSFIVAARLVSGSHESIAAPSIRGVVWEDQNRNGIHDEGEPGIANQAVYLINGYEYDPPFTVPFATNITDASGRYEFPGTTNTSTYIHIYADLKYRVTLRNVGDNDHLDNDFYQASTFCGSPFAIMPLSHVSPDDPSINAGLFALVPDLDVSVTINGRPGDLPLFVTNGTVVTMEYTLTNSGETALSWIDFYDDFHPDPLMFFHCPSSFPPGATHTFSHAITASVSVTNTEFLAGFPVEMCTCSCHGSDPPFWIHQSIIIVITNNPLDFDDGDELPNAWEIQYGLDPLHASPPGANSDGDWMTDYEEYIAGTDPTDRDSYLSTCSVSEHAITLHPTSTARLYGIWFSTNLLNESPEWFLHQHEQTGTGGTLVLPFSNDDPQRYYRIGVRLP